MLRSLYYLFDDSPARREDYVAITCSELILLKFCAHRWVEDVIVAERALKMWPHLKKYVAHFSQNPKKRPSCSSYKKVAEAVKTDIVKCRLEFFVSVAKVLQDFLVMFQTNAPMSPFLYKYLLEMTTKLCGRFIKSNAMSDLPSLEFRNSVNHMSLADVDIGFCAKQSLTAAIASRSLTEKEARTFRLECMNFLMDLVGETDGEEPFASVISEEVGILGPTMFREEG